MRSADNQLLSRPRVMRQLDGIKRHPLTVVRAPMGFGKTTAVREYIRCTGTVVIWLSLLGSEGSLDYCWERLAAQVGKVDPPLGERLRKLGFPADPSSLARVVEMIGGRAYAGCMVVVDDYHLMDSPEAARLVTLLAAERIPNLHIVLLARELTALPLLDLEQRGLCWLVEQEALEFRPDEIRDYIALMGYRPSEELVWQVERWTGGWPTGIYLMVRGLGQGRPVGRQDNIDKLLEDNLYAHYDPATRVFLQKLSFLDIFTPEQLATVFDEPDAPARLGQLARGNAFITWEKSVSGYQMTNLFRTFLQEKARADGLDPRPLWKRMGLWLLGRGKRTPAYDYLLRAGEFEPILEDLDRDEPLDIHHGQFSQIHRIFESLPEATALSYPLAWLRYVRVQALSRPPSVRDELVRILGLLYNHALSAGMPAGRCSRILGEIHNTWVFAAFNNPQEMIAHAAQAVEQFAGRYSCIVSNRTEFTFGSPHLLYCYHREPGKLARTARFISHRFHVLADAVEGCGAGSEPLALAEFALETGDWDNVELEARRAIHQSRLYGQISIEICATFTLARLAVARSQPAEADRLMRQLAEVVAREGNSVLGTTLDLCAAYLNICLGRRERIPDWLMQNDPSSGSFLYRSMAFQCVVGARAALLAGDCIRLDVLCNEYARRYAAYNTQFGLLHNQICAAVAQRETGGESAGRKALCRALDIAAPDNIVTPFAETAEQVLPMLRDLRTDARYPAEYLSRLIRCCERYRSAPPAPHRDNKLTAREREVLSMLALGHKHEEIAESLYISVSTVRYHVKNIYQKLEVNNKIAAVQKAQTLGVV